MRKCLEKKEGETEGKDLKVKYSFILIGTCYTSTECQNKGGTAAGNCAAG